MKEKANTVTRTIRAAPETLNEIKRLTDEMGLKNQGELFEELLQVWKLKQAQESIPGMQSPVEEINVHQDAIRYIVQKSEEEKKYLREELSKLRLENRALKRKLEGKP